MNENQVFTPWKPVVVDLGGSFDLSTMTSEEYEAEEVRQHQKVISSIIEWLRENGQDEGLLDLEGNYQILSTAITNDGSAKGNRDVVLPTVQAMINYAEKLRSATNCEEVGNALRTSTVYLRSYLLIDGKSREIFDYCKFIARVYLNDVRQRDNNRLVVMTEQVLNADWHPDIQDLFVEFHGGIKVVIDEKMAPILDREAQATKATLIASFDLSKRLEAVFEKTGEKYKTIGDLESVCIDGDGNFVPFIEGDAGRKSNDELALLLLWRGTLKWPGLPKSAQESLSRQGVTTAQ